MNEMKLDESGVKAAKMWAIEEACDDGVSVNEYIDGIIRAYLSAVAEREPVLWADPQAVADTSLSKHGSYTMPLFTSPPASELEAENARLRADRDDFKDEWQAELEKRKEVQARLRATETRLAEAMKALMEIDNLDEAMGHELTVKDAVEAVNIARRVHEGGKVDG